MTDYQSLVERYFTCWNTTEPGARRAAVDALFTPDCVFVDPMAALTGPAEIDAMIAAVQAQFPGFVISQLGTTDGHHDQARFGWEGALPGQAAVVAGSDVIAIGPDGRINQVFGFLDLVPSL